MIGSELEDIYNKRWWYIFSVLSRCNFQV